MIFWLGFMSHQHRKCYMATFQLYWCRKTSCASLCIISGTSGHLSRPTDVSYASTSIASLHKRIQCLWWYSNPQRWGASDSKSMSLSTRSRTPLIWYDNVWDYMIWYYIRLYDMILYMMWYDDKMKWYYDMWYDMWWWYNIWCCIISYHIMSYHESYQIVSYHIITLSKYIHFKVDFYIYIIIIYILRIHIQKETNANITVLTMLYDTHLANIWCLRLKVFHS